MLAALLPMVVNLVLGFIIGAVVLAGVKAVSRLRAYPSFSRSTLRKPDVVSARGFCRYRTRFLA
jgi:hypothetical protein